MTETRKPNRTVEDRLVAPDQYRTPPAGGWGFQVRALEVDGRGAKAELGGIAVPYGRDADIGWFLESFAPGSLSKSIAESARALPLLLFHDAMRMPVGSIAEWQDGADALRGVWKLDGSADAQEAARLADEGHLTGLSIRFAPIRSEWTTVEDFNPDLGASYKDSVVRTEARLLETSLVPTPAYETAGVEWVRSGERTLAPEARGAKLTGWQEWADQHRQPPGR